MPTTMKGQPIDQRTAVLDLPLPHIDNWHEDDVPRLRTALALIDTAINLLDMDMDAREAAMGARATLLEWAAARAADVAYAYDEQGRLQTVTATVAGVQRVTIYTYDAQGRLAAVSYPVAGGATRTETFQYDTQGRVSGVTAVEATDEP